MSRARRAALTAVLSAGLGCGSGSSDAVDVIIDAPPESSDAYPFDDIDQLRLAVARAGDEADLLEVRVPLGEPLGLDEMPVGADLVVHLTGEKDGIDNAYGRTCSFEVTDTGELTDPRLYFSLTTRWGPAAQPNVPERDGGHGFALADGSVAFVGGGGTSLELFDPTRTGAFELISEDVSPRTGAAYVPFRGNDLLVVGGVVAGGGVTEVERLSPLPELATIEGPPLRFHAGAPVVDDLQAVGRQDALVAGGELDGPGGFEVTDRAWLFSENEEGLTVREIPDDSNLLVARKHHTMTTLGERPDDSVLILGGVDAAGATVPTAEIYIPSTQEFQDAGVVFERSQHTAISFLGRFVLVIGGFDAAGDPATQIALYEPVSRAFSFPSTPLPADAGVTRFAVTELSDGGILVTGGVDATGAVTDKAYVVRRKNEVLLINAAQPLAAPRAGHSAVPLCDGTILVVGGADGAPAERYNPSATARRF